MIQVNVVVIKRALSEFTISPHANRDMTVKKLQVPHRPNTPPTFGSPKYCKPIFNPIRMKNRDKCIPASFFIMTFVFLVYKLNPLEIQRRIHHQPSIP